MPAEGAIQDGYAEIDGEGVGPSLPVDPVVTLNLVEVDVDRDRNRDHERDGDTVGGRRSSAVPVVPIGSVAVMAYPAHRHRESL